MSSSWTGWLFRNIHFSNDNGSFPFHGDFLFCTSDKMYTGLGYFSNTAGVLYETGIAYPSRTLGFTPFLLAWPVLLIFLFFCLLIFFLVLCFGHNVACVDGMFFRFSLTLIDVRIVTLHIIQLFNVLYTSVELNIFISKLMNPRRAINQTQWLQWLVAYIHIKTYQSNIENN